MTRFGLLPSGKHTTKLWKITISMGKLTINAMFAMLVHQRVPFWSFLRCPGWFSLSFQLYLQWHAIAMVDFQGNTGFWGRLAIQPDAGAVKSKWVIVIDPYVFPSFFPSFSHVFHDKSLLIGGKSMVNPPTDRRRTNSKMRWLLWLCPSPSRRCSTGRKPGTHQKKMMLKTSNYYRCTDTGSFIIR